MKIYLANNICVSFSPFIKAQEIEISTDIIDDFFKKKIVAIEGGYKIEIPKFEEVLEAENFMLKQNQLALEAHLIHLEKNILTGGK